MVEATPKTFNTWLQNNRGYNEVNDYMGESVKRVDNNTMRWIYSYYDKGNMSFEQLKKFLDNKIIVIGIIRSIVNKNGFHFVLIIGYSSEKKILYTHDPAYNSKEYSYEDFLRYKTYKTNKK